MQRSYLTVALLLALTLATVHTAAAQCADASASLADGQTQLVQHLDSTAERGPALDNILALSRRDCLVTADEALVDRLVAIYAEEGGRAQHKMLSALILGELGDADGLRALRRLVDDQESETVAKVTRAVLASQETVAMN